MCLLQLKRVFAFRMIQDDLVRIEEQFHRKRRDNFVMLILMI